MKILGMEESLEPCAEAGWYAYDIWVDRPIGPEQILSLASHGALTYLRQLKMPFYKLNQQYFYIQGMQGESQLRLAVYREEEEKTVAEVRGWIENW